MRFETRREFETMCVVISSVGVTEEGHRCVMGIQTGRRVSHRRLSTPRLSAKIRIRLAKPW